METDEYEPESMEVEYNSIIDYEIVKYNSEVVFDISNPDVNSKVYKINSYQEFEANTGINGVKYPFMFVFIAYMPELSNTDNLKEMLNCIIDKFNDNRPLIVEFQSFDVNKPKVYVKDGRDFVILNELKKFRIELNISIDYFDFPTFIGMLRYKIKPSQMRQKVLESDDFLIASFYKIFSISEEDEVELCCDVIKKSDRLNFFYAILNLSFGFEKHLKVSQKSKRLMSIILRNDDSILKTAIDCSKKQYISFIVNTFRSCFEEWPFYYKTMISQSLLPIPNMLRSFLEIDFPFPSNFKSDDELCQERIKLHKAIRDENDSVVENFTEENCHTKIGFNELNQSALMTALLSQNYETYCFLKQIKGYKFGSNEREQKVIDKIDADDIYQIAFGNMKYAQRDPKKFAQILASKSRRQDPSSSSEESNQKFKKIRKTFFELNEIPEVRKIFEITAENVEEIHFDLDSVDISSMYPDLENEDTFGLTLPCGVIFIAAGITVDDIKETIIHELAHFAMQVVYENEFRPYFGYKKSRISEFKEIIKIVNEIKIHTSNAVSNVFTAYKDEDLWSKELIVTVPVMIYKSFKNTDLLKAYRENYEKLFIFYEKVHKDFECFDSEKLKTLKELNKDFGVMKGITLKFDESLFEVENRQILISKIPKMTLASVFQNLCEEYETQVNHLFLFVDVKKILSDSVIAERYLKVIGDGRYEDVIIVFELPEDLDKVLKQISFNFTSFDTEQAANFSPLFQFEITNTPTFEVLKSMLFSKLLPTPDCNFIVAGSSLEVCSNLSQRSIPFIQKTIENPWEKLTILTQESILAKMVKFQNKEVKLSQIIKHQHANKIMDEEFLKRCLDDETLIINPIISSNEIYISRNLSKESNVTEIVEITDEEYQKRISRVKKSKTKTILLQRDNQKCKVKEIKTLTEPNLKENEILKRSENLTFVLISNAAGSGKSTVLCKFGDYLRVEHPHSLIYFVKLNTFLKDFSSLQDPVIFEEFFTNKILRDQSDFEKSIFIHSYKYSKIFLLFDGFDEISPKCKKTVLAFFKSFKASKGSQLWITTRDHLEVDLQKELKIKEVYSLDAFSKENQIEYLIKYWTLKKASGNLPEKAEKVVSSLSFVMSNSGCDLIGIPQQLETIADFYLHEDSDQNFIETASIYLIYKKSIAKKIKLWQNDRGELSSEASQSAHENDTNFYSLHKFLAMKVYFEKKISFCGITLSHMWTNDEIVRCGIIKHFEDNSPIFLHETFKEVFASIFIIQELEKVSNQFYQEIFEYFCAFLYNKRFEVVRMFISGGLRELKGFNDQKLSCLAAIFKENIQRNGLNLNLLSNISTENCVNLLQFVLDILSKLEGNFLKHLFNHKMSFFYKKGNIFHLVVESGNSTSFEALLTFTHKFLPADFTSLILEQTFDQKISILHIAAVKSLETFKKILNDTRYRLDRESMRRFLGAKTLSQQNTLFILSSMSSVVKLKFYWNCLEDFFTQEELAIIANSLDNENMSIFHVAITHGYAKIFEFLMTKIKPKLYVFKAERKFKRRNALQLLCFNRDLNFHQIFWKCLRGNFLKDELRDLILQSDVNKNNFLHILVAFADKHILTLTFNQLEEIFLDPNELKLLLRSKGFRDRNIIQKAVDYFEVKSEDQIVLWKFIKKIFGDEFVLFLNDPDSRNEDLLHIMAAFSTVDIISSFIEFLEDFMSHEEISYYLNSDRNNKSLYSYGRMRLILKKKIIKCKLYKHKNNYFKKL